MTLLNFYLRRIIPFNAPHKIHIADISKTSIAVKLPYLRRNLNHLKTLHACSLATACEYVAGLVLLREVGVGRYRIIMKDLSIEYHYRAKTGVTARAEIEPLQAKEELLAPLEVGKGVVIEMQSDAFDEEKNHICSCKTTWQVKPWGAVRSAS